MNRYMFTNMMGSKIKNKLDRSISSEESKKFINEIETKVIKQYVPNKGNIVEILWDELSRDVGLVESCHDAIGLNIHSKFSKINYDGEYKEMNEIFNSYPMYFKPDEKEATFFNKNDEKSFFDKIKIAEANRLKNAGKRNKRKPSDVFDDNGIVKLQISNTIIKLSKSYQLYDLDAFMDLFLLHVNKTEKLDLRLDVHNEKILNVEETTWNKLCDQKSKNNDQDDIFEAIRKFNDREKFYPFDINIDSNNEIVELDDYYYAIELEAMFNSKYYNLYKAKNRNVYGYDEVKQIINDIMKIRKGTEEDRIGYDFINTFLLEKTIGFNICLKIFNTLDDEFYLAGIKNKKSTLMPDIKEIVQFIMKFPNTYGRMYCVEAVVAIYFAYLGIEHKKDNIHTILENIFNFDIEEAYFTLCCTLETILRNLVENKVISEEIVIENLLECVTKRINDRGIGEKGIIDNVLYKMVNKKMKKVIRGGEDLYINVQEIIINTIKEHNQ